MSHRRSDGFTLWTSRGSGSYRTWGRAAGAARWTAEGSGMSVLLVNDESGQMWDVSPDGRVANHRR